MGRKRKTCIETMIQDLYDCETLETFKNKHRFADSKYRQKMQYLFDLLKENIKGTPKKDIVLSVVLENMRSAENDIINLVGSERLEKCKEEFLNLCELEEHIWKEVEEPSQWWEKIKEVLEEVQKADYSSSLSNISYNHILQKTVKSEILTKKRPIKRKRRAFKRSQCVKVPNDNIPVEPTEGNSLHSDFTTVHGANSSTESEEPPFKNAI